MGHRNWNLTERLKTAPANVFAFYAMAAAFSTYFCMYAFRKPFAAAKFAELKFLGTGVDLKTAFVISQIIGYALSKYIGIKVCSEVTRQRRAWTLVSLIAAAELALLLFAVLPPNLKVLAIFLNGLPLGMVWGLVVLYLEGRRTSELLLAGLSCSFIVSSGVVKNVGLLLLRDLAVTEAWMPFVTGLLFLVPFLLSVWFLNQLPQPDQADVDERVQRVPMNARQRHGFVRGMWPGLVLLFVVYFFLTAYRDFRDNYQVEIIEKLGYAGWAGALTWSELLVGLGVMICLAALNLVRDNRLGLMAAFGLMIGGLILMCGSTWMLDAKLLGGFWWMTAIGLGSYLAYVPYGSVLFDRMIASTRIVGTAVFAIYVADALGYTGSVGVQLYKDLAQGDMSRFEFLKNFTYALSLLGALLLIGSCLYFARLTARARLKSAERMEVALQPAE
jgi:Family of unknown function (DUF5690)